MELSIRSASGGFRLVPLVEQLGDYDLDQFERFRSHDRVGGHVEDHLVAGIGEAVYAERLAIWVEHRQSFTTLPRHVRAHDGVGSQRDLSFARESPATWPVGIVRPTVVRRNRPPHAELRCTVPSRRQRLVYDFAGKQLVEALPRPPPHPR